MDYDIVTDDRGLYLYLRLLATQHSFDAGEQDTWAKRFGQVIIGAQFEPSNDIRILTSGGQHHNGNARRCRIASQSLTNLQPIQAREKYVKHKGVREA